MALTAKNMQVTSLSPVYHPKPGGTFDPVENLKEVIAEPLFKPIIASAPAVLMAGNTQITADALTQKLLDCFDDLVNGTAEAEVKAIFGTCLINYNAQTHISVREAFAVQSGKAANLPEPTDKLIYTPAGDVIPASKNFMSGNCTYDEWFATLAWYARPETLGFYFVNDVAFDEFKVWLAAQASMLGPSMPADTNQLMADFQSLSLGNLTESIVLRNNDTDNNDPNSFARLILTLLMQYMNQVSPAVFGVLPFSIPELICPTSLVFVNVERHARATAKEIADEWRMINASAQNKPQMVSNSKLMRMTAAARNLQKIAQFANSAGARAASLEKSGKIVFRSKPTTTIDLARIIRKVVRKMENVNKSMNTYKKVKTSFAVPNRRDPDDFNKIGKIVSTQYKPDIHVYIDTSGSISEENYEESFRALIKMARKLNVNLYFNSFSHVLSQTTRLHVQGKSTAAIYKEFQRVQKVSGGTSYDQIWHFINRSKKRLRELSIVITDFEYIPPNRYIPHPKNLYYIPCSAMDWGTITRSAEQFCKSMLNNDPDIRSHLLF